MVGEGAEAVGLPLGSITQRLSENSGQRNGKSVLTADEQDKRRWKSDEMLEPLNISGFIRVLHLRPFTFICG